MMKGLLAAETKAAQKRSVCMMGRERPAQGTTPRRPATESAEGTCPARRFRGLYRLLAALWALALPAALLSGCASSSTSTPAQIESTLPIAQSSSVSSYAQPPAPSSDSGGPAITTDEAVQISRELSEGYGAMFSVVQFPFTYSLPYITVDGIHYYLRDDFAATRTELEELLGQFFSIEFVKRNMAKFFAPDGNYIQIIEQDGLLYYHEPGGIGGTYALWEDSLAVRDLSAGGWVFTMLGTAFDYDTGEDIADENDVCTFVVISENGRWVIDSYERMFVSDGSVYDVG